MDFLLLYIFCLSIGLLTDNGDKYEFHFLEWTLKLIKKWLVTAMAFMPLLYQWAFLHLPVIIEVLRILS